MAALETGRRRVTLVEFFALPQILEELTGEHVTLGDLIRGQLVVTKPGIEVDHDELVAAMPGRPTLVPSLDAQDKAWEAGLGGDLPGGILTKVPRAQWNEAWLSGQGEAEQKMARRLELPPGAVGMAAYALWGRSLTAERDARVSEQGTEDAEPRAIQAARGHVTRQLTDELQVLLEDLLDQFTEEV